jgi:hypothetical protein
MKRNSESNRDNLYNPIREFFSSNSRRETVDPQKGQAKSNCGLSITQQLQKKNLTTEKLLYQSKDLGLTNTSSKAKYKQNRRNKFLSHDFNNGMAKTSKPSNTNENRKQTPKGSRSRAHGGTSTNLISTYTEISDNARPPTARPGVSKSKDPLGLIGETIYNSERDLAPRPSTENGLAKLREGFTTKTHLSSSMLPTTNPQNFLSTDSRYPESQIIIENVSPKTELSGPKQKKAKKIYDALTGESLSAKLMKSKVKNFNKYNNESLIKKQSNDYNFSNLISKKPKEKFFGDGSSGGGSGLLESSKRHFCESSASNHFLHKSKKFDTARGSDLGNLSNGGQAGKDISSTNISLQNYPAKSSPSVSIKADISKIKDDDLSDAGRKILDEKMRTYFSEQKYSDQKSGINAYINNRS